MDPAAAQPQFLLMAAVMTANFTHQFLVRNFLPDSGQFILPGLAHLTAPVLTSPPPQPISQGPLPALTDDPVPAAASPDRTPREDSVLPERAAIASVPLRVPPSLKAQTIPRSFRAPSISPAEVAPALESPTAFAPVPPPVAVAPVSEPPGVHYRPVDPYLQHQPIVTCVKCGQL